MAPKKATEAEAPQGLNSNELRFIKAVFDNMTQKPDANWDKVAEDLSLKDAKCAKERFRQMSVRHGWREQGASGPSPKKPKAATTGAGVKKTRAPRATRAKKVKKEDDEEEGQDDDVKSEDDEL
jgi:hypothetical protein